MAKLGEICKINMGQSPDSATYNTENKGLPFFQGNADFGKTFPKVRMWCSEPKKIAKENDVLISVRAPIGAMNIADCECCIGRGLAALTPNEECCSQKYLWHALGSKVDELNSKGTGSTFKAISKKTLEETEIVLPSIEVQNRIAKILDKIDRIVDNRCRQVDRLDELVKSRFIEMFGDPEFNTKQWPTKKLSQLCSISSSKRVYKHDLSLEGIPFLRISDLNELIDNIENTPELFIPNDKFNELKNNGLVPNAGDILVTSRGTLGRCYIVKECDEFYFQDGMISWLSNLDSQLTNMYLSHLFMTSGIQKQIESLQAGSTVTYLSIAMLKILNIILPPLDLQNQFADFVAQVDKSKLVVQKSLEQLKILKKALMQEYFG